MYELNQSFTLRVWAEVSSSAPHLLILVSPHRWRCLLRLLRLVRRPITTPDCVLLKDRSLVFAVRTRPRNKFSSLSLGTDKTPPFCHMLVMHPAFYLSYILLTDPQGRFSFYKYLKRAVSCDLFNDLISSYSSLSRDPIQPHSVPSRIVTLRIISTQKFTA